jgi:PAS domain S-box-containing protein
MSMAVNTKKKQPIPQFPTGYPAVSRDQEERAYLNILEDMQVDKQAMENQRKATFNILEDITQAQLELKARLLQVNTLRETLEGLSTSLDPKHIMELVTKSITKLVPYYTLSYVIHEGQGDRFGNTIYVHSKGFVGRKYISHIQRDLVSFVRHMPKNVTNRSTFLAQLKEKMYSEFLSGDYVGVRDLTPEGSFVIPLIVGAGDGNSYALGLFHIASLNPRERLTEYQMEILHDIANVSALNMERIKSIAATEQARLANLLRSLSNGVLLFDTHANILLSNPAAMRMLGLPEQNLLTQKEQRIAFSELANLLTSDEFHFPTVAKRVLEFGEEFNIERLSLSRFIYEIFVVPVRNLSKAIIGGAVILHDITHLDEIDRMKTEFVSIASHQLRTPLTAMRLFIEMLESGEVGELGPQQREYVQQVGQSTSRMIKLVNDLLNVSRLETGRLRIDPVPTNLVEFIQEVVDSEKPIAETKGCIVTFRSSLPQSSVSDAGGRRKILEGTPSPVADGIIPIDQSLFRQVVHNLITNAIKYSKVSTGKDCVVEVELKHDVGLQGGADGEQVHGKGVNKLGRQEDSSKIIRSVSEHPSTTVPSSGASRTSIAGGQYLLSIADHGIGIAASMKPHIFQKFFRTDRARKADAGGSGLGLYVAKMIMEAGGGKLWFESKSGEGSTFFVSIPEDGMRQKEGEKSVAS